MTSFTSSSTFRTSRLLSTLRQFWADWLTSQEEAAASSLKRHVDPLTGRSERKPGGRWMCY